jgi:hypothetical protein
MYNPWHSEGRQANDIAHELSILSWATYPARLYFPRMAPW